MKIRMMLLLLVITSLSALACPLDQGGVDLLKELQKRMIYKSVLILGMTL